MLRKPQHGHKQSNSSDSPQLVIRPPCAYGIEYFDSGDAKYSNYLSYDFDSHKNKIWTRTALSLGLSTSSRVLDFGCAKGFMVHGLRSFGIEAYGTDISPYAIRNAIEPHYCYHYTNTISPLLIGNQIDTILSFHTLEHLNRYQLFSFLNTAASHKIKKILIVVPLGLNGRYNNPAHELDVTHVQRMSAMQWRRLFHLHGYVAQEAESLNNDVLFASFIKK
ncbi:methyltransferase domain-containing protein [Ectothiorhodospiraceae bacterium WFHF3C12]|nr:methyltransferase domain-containing protein [Ectothiorhodospiraceae bacterium WFHF3C12]